MDELWHMQNIGKTELCTGSSKVIFSMRYMLEGAEFKVVWATDHHVSDALDREGSSNPTDYLRKYQRHKSSRSIQRESLMIRADAYRFLRSLTSYVYPSVLDDDMRTFGSPQDDPEGRN